MELQNNIIRQVNAQNEQINKVFKAGAEEREQRYIDAVGREKRMIELLESIDKNTCALSDVVKLLEENTKDQAVILEIISEFNSLATIKDKKEAQSLYRKIMNKISTGLSDINTINTLFSYGMIIYNMIHY